MINALQACGLSFRKFVIHLHHPAYYIAKLTERQVPNGGESFAVHLPRKAKAIASAAYEQARRAPLSIAAPLRATHARALPSLGSTKQKSRTRRLFCLVDPRGIEPLSENLFTGPSSWTVCDLKFPLNGGHRRSPLAGSPFLHDRYKCELSVHVHHCMTPQPWSWSSSVERAAKEPRHCLN